MIDLSQEFHFTPNWTTEGGEQPQLWNGTLTGHWDPHGIRDLDGKELRPAGLRIALEIGSLTRCGTGPWVFKAQGFNVTASLVTCSALDFGKREQGGVAVVAIGGDTLFPSLYRHGGREHQLTRITAIEPWTWSAGDRLSFFVPAEHVQARGQWMMTLPVVTS